MPFPNPANPGEVRAHMQAALDRYGQGVDVLPGAWAGSLVEDYPKKSEHVVKALGEAWRDINDADSYYRFAASRLAEEVYDNQYYSRGRNTPGLLVATLGKNALRFGLISAHKTDFYIQETLLAGRQKDEFLLRDSVSLAISGLDLSRKGRQWPIIINNLGPSAELLHGVELPEPELMEDVFSRRFDGLHV